jgi:hypothetical protein
MKHLLNGVAVAAALVIAASAWAQNPPGQPSLQTGVPKAGTASPNVGATPAPGPMTHHRHKRMPMSHMAKRSGGATTAQLNREELARIQGGAPPQAPMSAVPGQPSLQRGEPGAGMPSPSYHTPQ